MPFDAALSEINRAALPLEFGMDSGDAPPRAYGGLLEWIGERPIVLIGEASHGTHDFYRERARITRLLIERKGFNAVAIEGDWPDAHRVHRFVNGRGDDADARQALSDFVRFPSWMWRNMDVLAFVEWLRAHNADAARRVGFHGLDLYSLHASMRAVLDYLDVADPEGAKRARYRYSCFDHYGEDTQAYGYAAAYGLSQSCEDGAVAQLVELRARATEIIARDGRLDPDEHLSAEQNARLVRNAEHYYRAMFAGRAESWNVRDRHMAETLEWLYRGRGVKNPAAGPLNAGRKPAGQLRRADRKPAGRLPEADRKIVVWAHNSHLGDARATEMGTHGEVNLGQLTRERFGEKNVFSLGFTTHSGEVTAASQWDAPAERKRVRLALDGSYEKLFHHTGLEAFLLNLHDKRVASALERPMLERAIGVIYLPRSERGSHYFDCSLPHQFDAVIHLDRTRALVPLERFSSWEAGETPDTYPFAV